MSKKKQSVWSARQGDVLIWSDGKPIAAMSEIPREAGAVVLAHGEVTGHKHQIRDPGVCHLRAEGTHPYTVLRVTDDVVSLVHEEHATITIPRGDYFCLIQEEYAPEDYRNVLD